MLRDDRIVTAGRVCEGARTCQRPATRAVTRGSRRYWLCEQCAGPTSEFSPGNHPPGPDLSPITSTARWRFDLRAGKKRYVRLADGQVLDEQRMTPEEVRRERARLERERVEQPAQSQPAAAEPPNMSAEEAPRQEAEMAEDKQALKLYPRVSASQWEGRDRQGRVTGIRPMAADEVAKVRADLPAAGHRFHKLEVLCWSAERGRPYVDALCDCGVIKTVRLDNLRTGNQKTCGCGRRARRIAKAPPATEAFAASHDKPAVEPVEAAPISEAARALAPRVYDFALTEGLISALTLLTRQIDPSEAEAFAREMERREAQALGVADVLRHLGSGAKIERLQRARRRARAFADFRRALSGEGV